MNRRINKTEVIKKMNASQLMGFLEFGKIWLLSEPEVKRRTALIEETILDFSSVSEKFATFFKLEGTIKSTKPALIMAHLKPISDVMLSDYIQALGEFFLFMVSGKEEHAQNCETLMRPSFDKLKDFLESGPWRNLLIGMEVTGEEFQTINGMTIPFTPEAIHMHIDRIRAFPITAKDIAKIKYDFYRYNESLYAKISKDEISVFDALNSQHQFMFNPVQITKIYSECERFDIISITLGHFIMAVTLGNFKGIVFTPEYKGQHLIYCLSKTLGQHWYKEVTINLGWSKSVCSGHKQRLENDKWAKAIRKLIPELHQP